MSASDPQSLTPRGIVAELDKYIVGQAKAKRAVAIAMRNRYRRERVAEEMRGEIVPKNILMIGPTGVGKTEIARRLATLAGAPFVKVEATKYTEVGYVGRDVESMVRDLVEAAIRMVSEERREEVRAAADLAAVERTIDLLFPETRAPQPASPSNPLAATLGSIFGNTFPPPQASPAPSAQHQPPPNAASIRETARNDVLRGFYDVRLVEIEVEETPNVPMGMMGGDPSMGGDMSEMLGSFLPKRKTRKRVTVADARRLFAAEEETKLIDMDAVKREALRRAGENGIVFIDEIDKVAGREGGRGPDVSREGVQRDILPIVEGSTVQTKHRGRRLSRQQTLRLDPRAAGPVPDSGGARLAHRGRLCDDPDPAQERARGAVPSAAGSGKRDGALYPGRDRADRHVRNAGQRANGKHRGAPVAHGARAVARGRVLCRAGRGRRRHGRRRLRARAARRYRR